MKTVFFKKDDEIIQEGTLSDCAYIIGEGRVEVSKKLPNGNKQIIGVLNKNEIFEIQDLSCPNVYDYSWHFFFSSQLPRESKF